ncbi:MAG: sorbosone dehydrogenase [Gemmatimonadetes bacterium]|nr:MAG: sorbosone dehydrogenase [Gemmatimonadota bacterium]
MSTTYAAGRSGPLLATLALAFLTAVPGSAQARCDDTTGLTLPDGFCAELVAEVPGARHITVAPNGDIFVAVRNTVRRGASGRERVPGGVVALRDTDGDGHADVQERFGDDGGTGIWLDGEWLYFAPDDRVLRYHIPPGSLRPDGPAEVIVSGLPAGTSHSAKSIVVADGWVYVNIGGPSNACQAQARTQGSPGLDPCPQLERRGGIWRFSTARTNQTQDDGERFATGLRNVVALGWNAGTGSLFGVQHGRDSLHELFPDLFTEEQRVEKPSEEFVLIERGDDFGWPYCYHDPETGRKVLAPEYGGDGHEVGRCADKKMPLVGFPAHWAPNGLTFYHGDQFPPEYRGGAFIAFHGSWNRAPAPQAGYNVVFQPMDGDRPAGDWVVFADGFAGENVSPGGARHRPSGVAVGPDGSLYVSDDRGGAIFRIRWAGR